MKKYVLITSLFLCLFFSCLIAQMNTYYYEVRLIDDHVLDYLGTTYDIQPTLKFQHWQFSRPGVPEGPAPGFSPLPMYYLFKSESPEFITEVDSFPIPGLATPPLNSIYSFKLENVNALEYDTIYYWQVRIYLNIGTVTNPEYVETDMYGPRSDIHSFRTPKASILPFIKWDEIDETGDYLISYVEGTTAPTSWPTLTPENSFTT